MRVGSPEWVELEERRREEESRLRGVEPAPRYTFRDMVIEVIHGTNQADPNVIEGECEVVDDSDSPEDAEIPELGIGFEEDY